MESLRLKSGSFQVSWFKMQGEKKENSIIFKLQTNNPDHVLVNIKKAILFIKLFFFKREIILQKQCDSGGEGAGMWLWCVP